MKTYGIGVVGCGNISDIYLKNITTKFRNLKLIGVCDLDQEKARAQAEKYGTKTMDYDGLLANPEVDIVLNITNPINHKSVSDQAIRAGKHVYLEKPLALTRSDGKELLDLAREKGVFLGGAPDTFLGAGIQTCKSLIQEGWIGDVIGCHGFMTCHGHESWHPDPEFYYAKGGGPLFDMGPYYLTAMVKLIGSITQVTAMTKKSFAQRTITSPKKHGKVIPVEVPTHVLGLLEFDNGAIGHLTTSFDVWAAEVPRIELFGTKGTLCVPDPNTFGGPVRLMTQYDSEFKSIPLRFPYAENSRGLGLSEMADAIDQGRVPEAGGDLTYHVLEVMESLHQAWETKSFLEIPSRA
jgi:predicted dehydrogenase